MKHENQHLLDTWSRVNAIVMLTFLGASVYSPLREALAAWLLPASAGTLTLTVLWITSGKMRIADILTMIRPYTGLLLVILSVNGKITIPLLAVITAAAALSDAADGFAARRSGVTQTGARLDMESDAFFIAILGILLITENGAPYYALVPGMFRYVFVLVFTVIKPKTITAGWFKLLAKAVCVLSVTLLAVMLIPAIPEPAREAVIHIVIILLAISFLLETMFYLTADSTAAGIAKSLFIYYLIPLRISKMTRFYSQFVSKEDLVFDIGAHVGNRLFTFTKLGCRVVALEPEPLVFSILSLFFGKTSQAVLRKAAVGPVSGTSSIFLSPGNPTLTTLSKQWIDQVSQNSLFNAVTWQPSGTVTTVTLDQLIEEHGEPAFVKIDVEGFEAEVLKGLSKPLNALSFEYLPASIHTATECIDLLGNLGDYEFNYSKVETMRMVLSNWTGPEQIKLILMKMPGTGSSGDVYARLKKQS